MALERGNSCFRCCLGESFDEDGFGEGAAFASLEVQEEMLIGLGVVYLNVIA